MDCIVHGVAKSQTRLTAFHFTSLQFLKIELLLLLLFLDFKVHSLSTTPETLGFQRGTHPISLYI